MTAPSRAARRRTPFAHRYGPTAVVTGASSGIGRELAREVAARGLDVVLVARREAALRELADDVAARHGVRADILPLDLADPGATARLVAATDGRDVGLLVAAAGFGTSGPLLSATAAIEREMLQVNCAAVLDLVTHFGGRAVARGRGGLVLLGSVVGFQGVPGAAHYAATKAYVQSLAEGLHAELAPLGVDVLSAAPGPVATGFAERAGLSPGGLDPAAIAPAILDALGRRPTVLPGRLSQLLGRSLAPLPRRARVRVMGAVMARMVAARG